MVQKGEVRERKLEHAIAAGRRWRDLCERRADTVRRLVEGGPEAADSPERVARYQAREAAKRLAFARAGVTEAMFRERRIGPTLDLDEIPPNEPARIAGIPVARIVELDDRGRAVQGFATGFLIGPNLLITNHHVFAAEYECQGCGVQFGHERTTGGVSAGVIFALDTRYFFHVDAQLDYAVVGVNPTSIEGGIALQDFSLHHLIAATGKILVGHAISIIQHPDGGIKKYGVRDNELLIAPTDADLFLQYTTDTLPGSSGSPAFNKDWEVVGLHHSGVPEIRDGTIMTIRGTPWTRDLPDSEIHWVANEGARVSRICQSLREAQVKTQHRPALAELVRSFRDDFASLAALQSQQEITGMDANTGAAPRGISITVHGTANFYFAGGTLRDQVAAQLPIALPAPAIEKKLLFDSHYDGRPGYNEDFLDINVPHPEITKSRLDEILLEDGKPHVLKYHHYSLVMNRRRKLAMWAAANVDYHKSKRRKTREEFGEDTWTADPRVANKHQIEDPELYEPALKFDRGHIIRRDDVAWGETAKEEVFANSDSFHWTNCTPQHEQFNRAVFQFHGLWGDLENHIQTQAKNVGLRMTIFAGPVLDNAKDIRHDFGTGEVKVPRRYWKIVIVVEKENNQQRLRAYGFILDQSQAIDEFGIEKFGLGKFTTFQFSLASIAKQAGLVLDKKLLGADAMGDAGEDDGGTPIESLSRVRM